MLEQDADRRAFLYFNKHVDGFHNEGENILLVPNPNGGRFQLRTVLENYRV